jgi:hypothetical protein
MNFANIARRACGLAAFLLAAGSAHAQLFRSYLSLGGSDSNPCTVSAPCRLLPAALAAVADGGEIWILDSANYNTATVSITKSVTILAIPGAVGSVVAAGGGPALQAITAGTHIALRNLVITNLLSSPGTHGVDMSADELTVEDCKFSNLVNDGIQAYGSSRVKVVRGVFSGNNVGLRAYGDSRVNISNSSFFDNGFAGVLADGIVVGTAVVDVSDVVVTGSQFGLIAWSKIASSNVQLHARHATVSAALEGVVSFVDTGVAGTALVGLGGSLVSGNDTGLVSSGPTGVLKVFGDNQVSDNTTADSTGTLTPVARR